MERGPPFGGPPLRQRIEAGKTTFDVRSRVGRLGVGRGDDEAPPRICNLNNKNYGECSMNAQDIAPSNQALQGRTLFITGASRGIGKAIALRVAGAGANVVVAAKTDQRHPRLEGTIHETVAEMALIGYRVDLTGASNFNIKYNADKVYAYPPDVDIRR